MIRFHKPYRSALVMFVSLFCLCLGSLALASTDGQQGAIDQQWIEAEINKTKNELQNETDPAKKLQRLNYLEKLDQLQKNKQKDDIGPEDGWVPVDFSIKQDQSYLNYDPAGGWADGKYEFQGAKYVKTEKKNIWQLTLAFTMKKKGWQKYNKVVKCLVFYDGRNLQIKDETGNRYSLNVHHKDPEIVISKDSDGNKIISKMPMTKGIDFEMIGGHVHLVLEF